MGADLARMKKGMKTKTGMSMKQLEDFASKGKSKAMRSYIRKNFKSMSQWAKKGK